MSEYVFRIGHGALFWDCDTKNTQLWHSTVIQMADPDKLVALFFVVVLHLILNQI